MVALAWFGVSVILGLHWNEHVFSTTECVYLSLTELHLLSYILSPTSLRVAQTYCDERRGWGDSTPPRYRKGAVKSSPGSPHCPSMLSFSRPVVSPKDEWPAKRSNKTNTTAPLSVQIVHSSSLAKIQQAAKSPPPHVERTQSKIPCSPLVPSIAQRAVSPPPNTARAQSPVNESHSPVQSAVMASMKRAVSSPINGKSSDTLTLDKKTISPALRESPGVSMQIPISSWT